MDVYGLQNLTGYCYGIILEYTVRQGCIETVANLNNCYWNLPETPSRIEPAMRIGKGNFRAATIRQIPALSSAPETGSTNDNFLPVLSLYGARKEVAIAAGTSPDT